MPWQVQKNKLSSELPRNVQFLQHKRYSNKKYSKFCDIEKYSSILRVPVGPKNKLLFRILQDRKMF